MTGARRAQTRSTTDGWCSGHTVKNLKNIPGKLHLRTRREAADYVLARGWVHTTDVAS
jgi:hypothetical protein